MVKIAIMKDSNIHRYEFICTTSAFVFSNRMKKFGFELVELLVDNRK